jgi:outer membrane lipopolysaccharide assembly protein LptE/RlpB
MRKLLTPGLLAIVAVALSACDNALEDTHRDQLVIKRKTIYK